MKILISISIIFCFQILNAQVLLVPTADRNFDNYLKQCQKEGYICTTTYMLERLVQQPTPQFDLLIEELDYSSKEFCNDLANRTLKILKTEMISIEQAEILIKVVNQAGNFVLPQFLKPLQVIEKQLQEDLDHVQKANLRDLPDEFTVVFKKPVRIFKSNFLKEKTEKIKFTQTLTTQENLISGSCGNEKIHSTIQDVKWQIYSEDSCGLSYQLANFSKSSSIFVKENKKAFLIGSVIAIGAVILLNKYEVEFTF